MQCREALCGSLKIPSDALCTGVRQDSKEVHGRTHARPQMAARATQCDAAMRQGETHMSLQSSVTAEGITHESTTAFGITNLRYAKERHGLAAFWGSIQRDMMDSEYGVKAWQGLGIMDLLHRYEPEKADHFRLTIETSNAREKHIKVGDSVADMMTDAQERVYWFLLDIFSDMRTRVGGPEVPDAAYVDDSTELYQIATDMVRDKFVRDAFRAYKTECKVIEDLESEGYEVVATTDEIAEHMDVPAGYDSYESAGIDLLVIDDDLTTVQVKEGEGGKTEDESDILARYIWDDKVQPEVRYTQN